VFAVPGEITSALSAGTNALLRLGATPLTTAADVLKSLGIEPVPHPALTHPFLQLLPATADELARSSGLGPGEIAAMLTQLEIKGLAAEGDGIFRALE
jgi:DNA processing protein